ncbi:MAG: S49 family peptidase [Candidatus Nealsonbacteria bacterium CG_4_9_14_3_um_filter_37_29]|uniref:S49 family peptidase n=1 Tax=Candidatus Nealsonbacteria bacterium CG_4_9_14_3_um_filter_37_29 TaxID=1974696 RepID=A0A2M7Z3F9_9BACT|nr:MAG: S49 family peptidase [Candidatus Nealsonbacteria bacterium CG_4_9_14_3_um_filter_37_29]
MPYNLREKLNLVKNKMEVWFTPTPIFLVWGWIILALIIGGLISVFSFREFIAKPEVGVIRISGPILFQEQTDEILEQLRYAKEKKTIKAVVLEIDSPGGEASVVEGIYLALLRLREEKPIVASINQRGASGGYYIALASNFIYAKPDSEIGSIGAWTSLPYPEMPSEDILPTGPFKDTGMTRQKAVGQLEMLRQSFLGVVLFHRGEKLKISADELTKAEVYTGIEGLGAGLIDEIGSNFDAIEKAADYAGIAHYQVVDIAGKMAEKVQTEKWGVTQPTTESKKELLPTYYYLIESR